MRISKSSNLGDNQIKSISRKSFNNLKKLKSLMLFGNKIEKLPCKAFSEMTSLTEIGLGEFFLMISDLFIQINYYFSWKYY